MAILLVIVIGLLRTRFPWMESSWAEAMVNAVLVVIWYR